MWISIVLAEVKSKTCERERRERNIVVQIRWKLIFSYTVVDQSRLEQHPCPSKLLVTHVPFILLPCHLLGCCTHEHNWSRVTVISIFQPLRNRLEEKSRVNKCLLSNWGVHWPHHVWAHSTGAKSHMAALSFKRNRETYSLSHVLS